MSRAASQLAAFCLALERVSRAQRLPLFEIALVLVRFNHVAGIIVKRAS